MKLISIIKKVIAEKLLFITRSPTFKCSLDHAKRSLYRSEEVVLELIKSKCLPILLYGLEVFN